MNDNKIPAVFSYIASRRNDMTLRENEIANFVLKNPEFIVNNTITNIANEVGVSETSINRFCKKIGYKGFQDFKIAMVQGSLYRDIQSDHTVQIFPTMFLPSQAFFPQSSNKKNHQMQSA